MCVKRTYYEYGVINWLGHGAGSTGPERGGKAEQKNRPAKDGRCDKAHNEAPMAVADVALLPFLSLLFFQL